MTDKRFYPRCCGKQHIRRAVSLNRLHQSELGHKAGNRLHAKSLFIVQAGVTVESLSQSHLDNVYCLCRVTVASFKFGVERSSKSFDVKYRCSMYYGAFYLSAIHCTITLKNYCCNGAKYLFE